MTAEFVVGGYSAGQGGRAGTFGALLVGGYDQEGHLHYAAHVGTGFDRRLLAELRARLESIRIEGCPFVGRPPLRGGTTWVSPTLVAEVKFAQWTPDGYLRAPVFVRLREDKAPEEAQHVGGHKGARPKQSTLPFR